MGLLIVAAMASGCGAQRHDASFNEIQSLTASRTGGKRVQWEGHSADDREISAAVHELLARPLRVDDAVQVALLNNRRLQATFEDLGVAQADLVQAGLLRNPVLDLSLRVPTSAPFKTYLNFAVAQNVLDVFLIPARKRIAAAQLEQAKAKAANAVFELAAQAASAFYAWQGAQQRVELWQSIADASAASLDVASRLRQAGNTTELAYLSDRAQAGRAKVDLANAKADAAQARERLNALMGITDEQLQWSAAARLPDLPPYGSTPGDLEALATRQRQDLAAARADVLTQARVYGVTLDTRFFAAADLGVDAERETDGQWRIGPSLVLPVPLFDQGQAAIPRAAALLRRSRQQYAALAIEIRSQVRAARTRMHNARETARFYHDEILPTQQRLLEQTQLQYNGMLVGVFQLLQAKRDEIDAAVQYVNALQNYWTARAELERAIGGRLPEAVAPTTGPATHPSAALKTHGRHDGEQP